MRRRDLHAGGVDQLIEECTAVLEGRAGELRHLQRSVLVPLELDLMARHPRIDGPDEFVELVGRRLGAVRGMRVEP
jgi:hypothetical protein